MKNKDKEKIFELIKDYYEKHHNNKKYQKGDYIPYASRVYDEKELINLIDASLDFWLTGGDYTSRFEQALGNYLNIKYVSFVNSGSSANLLALTCLMSSELKDRKINKGDEIITVACGFPTTVGPIVQLGLIPVFVDITIPQYNIDITQLEDALSDKTKAVFLAHTLGNPFDLSYIKEFCDRHNLYLIEDNCDALGSRYDNQYTGTFGDVATSSFYPAHHITTGEGGAVYTNNPVLHKIIRSLRDWGRDCICPGGKENLCNKRYDGDYGLLPHGYDHKYVYSHFGYNLKATDLQASIGLAQMDKLDEFISKRIENFNYLNNKLIENNMDEYFILPEAIKNSVPSWFGYILTCKENVDCLKIINYLDSNRIQTRKLFAGNIIRQPCFDELRDTDNYRVINNLNNTDYVMEHSFWLGVAPSIDKDMLDYMVEKLIEAVKQ